MDLTSLSTTLPAQGRKSPESQYDYPPAALMSAFKQAALSVTTLYKTANGEIEQARKQGYQDCLEDLLQLINSERIYPNSEVIKIREWGLAERRRAGGDTETGAPLSDPVVDESEDERSRSRTAGSSSPMQADPLAPPVPLQQHTRTPPVPPSYENTPTPPPPPQAYEPPPTKDSQVSFTFRSAHPVMEDIELADPTSNPTVTALDEQPPHHINHNNFSASSHRASSGAWKRRFPDFLELAAMAEKEKGPYAGMEFGGGGKRGRMT